MLRKIRETTNEKHNVNKMVHSYDEGPFRRTVVWSIIIIVAIVATIANLIFVAISSLSLLSSLSWSLCCFNMVWIRRAVVLLNVIAFACNSPKTDALLYIFDFYSIFLTFTRFNNRGRPLPPKTISLLLSVFCSDSTWLS